MKVSSLVVNKLLLAGKSNITRYILTSFLQMVFILFLALLLPVYGMGQQMTKDELKSMEKSNSAFKGGIRGVRGPGLNLSAEKMQWWEHAKFGMFIHWGLYAIPATGEWVMFNDKMSPKTYAKYADEFQPMHFDADLWASIAKNAGMKYMVMVARHHDGFAMWDSPSSYLHFDSKETAAHQDFVLSFTKACRKANLAVGIYYSPMDWRFPGYFNPTALPENAALMKKQAYGQVEELMKNYGKIDILWYDGGWLAHKGGDADAAWFWEPLKLNTMVRRYQPNIVINPRSGMMGDFQVNEGEAEVKGPIIDIPWEKCLSLNRAGWGYNKIQDIMSLKSLLQMLVNVVDRGGNLLLNVGPDVDGIIPVGQVERLKQAGDWLKVNGESIYGTRPGPIEPVDSLYGSTQKGDTIFIHVIRSSKNGPKLKLPPIKQHVISCGILRGSPIRFKQDKSALTLMIDPSRLDPAVTTLKLVFRHE